MRIKKSDRLGTIHDLPVQLANMSELDKINPKTVKAKNEYTKIFELYKLFPKDATSKEKNAIISKLKLMNFDQQQIEDQKRILKATIKFNKLIDKKREELEDEVRAGINVKLNMEILRGNTKATIDIPKDVRRALNLQYKDTRLLKFNTFETKNSLKFYSGQDFNFKVKDSFNKLYFVSYDELQKIRREGNAVEFLLKKFKNGVLDYYEKDRLKYEKSDPKKWLAKKKIYNKILNEVIDHNLQIATNKTYNEDFVKRNKNGKISKRDSRIPVLMNIFHELIDLYIP